MASPKELLEAADAIEILRQLPAVQRHPELDAPLRAAGEWARKQYQKVSESGGPRPKESRKVPASIKRRRE